MNARACRLFAVVLLAVLTVPRMTQRGMFGDGLIYATISQNLARGVGSFWAPAYTETEEGPFFEAPPLGFGLQAIAFRIVGGSPATERLYSLAAFALTGVLIVLIWRRLAAPDTDWVPLLFWVQPSIVTWAVVNNMLENTQVVFTTAAVWLLMVAAASPSAARAAGVAALAGLASVAAVLTKGPVGLFPLAIPVVLRIGKIHRSTSRALLHTIVMLVVVALCGVAIFSYPPSRYGFSEYLIRQLAPSLAGAREVNPDPFALFPHFWFGIGLRMAALSAVALAIGWKWMRWSDAAWRPAVFFLTAALSASVPISVSPKLAGHYFLPSTPLFAMAFAAATLPPFAALARSGSVWARRVPVALAMALAIAAVALVASRGVYEPRDTALIADLDTLAPSMPRDLVIGSCPSTREDWRLRSYLNRYFGVSLDAHGQPLRGWLLDVGAACPSAPPCEVAARGADLTLFRCP